MSKEQLKHIFEDSTCLTARQVKGYVTGKMVHEEAHAVEVHLLSCPFCSDAVEAMTEHKSRGAVAVMEKLDAGFIAKHFGVTTQEITVTKNTPPVLKAGAYTTAPEKEQPKAVRKLWKPMALAASLLAVVAVLWFMRDNIFPQDGEQLAQQVAVPEKQEEPVIAYKPATDTNSTLVADTAIMATEVAVIEDMQTAVPDPVVDKAKALKEAALLKDAGKKPVDEKLTAAAALAVKKSKEEIKPLPMAARQPSADALPRMGNSYTGPEPPAATPTTTADKAAKEEVEAVKKNVEPARTGLEKADDLFNKGKYRRALKMYQDEMGDTRSNRRDAATYMAARCHIELGEKMQARTLLNSLVNENSVKKGQAQQILNQIGDE
ncbi:MAG: hypothetical protein H3C54_09685 [Taibaiella sp.]|nr:hypothetical protein [Taibaiella sp.]